VGGRSGFIRLHIKYGPGGPAACSGLDTQAQVSKRCGQRDRASMMRFLVNNCAQTKTQVLCCCVHS